MLGEETALPSRHVCSNMYRIIICMYYVVIKYAA